MNGAPVVIGVDNGGTWVRICIRHARGKLIHRIQKPCPPLRSLPRFLKQQLLRYRHPETALAIGSKGVWKKAMRDWLTRAMKPHFQRVCVMSDVEAVWHAAFGRGASKQEGIVLISGTGSIAYGRNRRGLSARAGGLGPKVGDEGSGYWIAHQWFSKNGRDLDRAVRDVAQQAPRIVQRARKGHRAALEIIGEAHWHLANLVDLAAKQLRFKKRIPLCLHGSVLLDPWFKKGMLKEFARRGQSIRLVPGTIDVADALSRMRPGV